MIDTLKVLLADNPSTTMQVLNYALQSLGMEVFNCGTGKDAIRMYEEIKPDIFILDIKLPDMHGFEVVKKIRTLTNSDEWVPIIYLTSLNEDVDLMEGIDVGGDDFLYKPISEIIIGPKILVLQRIARSRKQLLASAEKLGLSNSELLRLVNVDGLTGVLNRRHFNEHISKEWRRMQRLNSPLCLLLCDVDHFKLFNDTYGHLAGDRCLNAVAETISKNVTRSGDTVSRYGGEEFTVLLPNTTLDGGVQVAEKIREAVGNIYPNSHSKDIPQVTVSIGVASIIPKPEEPAELLIAAADKALYDAKNSGRNTVSVYDYLNNKIEICALPRVLTISE